MNPSRTLVLGTRGSDLALAQSLIVREALERAHPGLTVRQRVITTTGDAQASLALQEPTAEGAGLFSKQLEEALLAGEIDLAVHSLKDLPVKIQAGLVLAAILPRAPVEDLLVSRHPGGLGGLPGGATVGTSSPRRALLLQKTRPDLRVVPIRGNVPTRLAKVAEGSSCDATVLAAAGLARLGHDLSTGGVVTGGVRLYLEPLEWMLPAPGQGAIAVETRCGDWAEGLLRPLHDGLTERCVRAERLVLEHLGGGCQLALGALAREAQGEISLRAVYIPDERAEPLLAEARATTPDEAARLAASQLLPS